MFSARGTNVYIGDTFLTGCESAAKAMTYAAWAQVGYQRGLQESAAAFARMATIIADHQTLARQFANHSPGRDAQRGADMPPRNRSGDDSPADRGDPAGSTPSEPGVVIGGDLHAVEGGNVVSLIGITDKGQVRIVDAQAC